MNCEQVKPVLMDFVMDEVSAADRGEVTRHLESCAACSAEAGKFRQTLAAMAAGAAFEDVPQKIRIVAEPANRWMAFWRNPARLGFAAAGLACVAIAALALAHTTVSYQQGNFEIAFGAAALRAVSPVPSSAAAPLSLAPASLNSGITREQAEKLITEAVAASESKMFADTARVVKASAAQTDINRINDRRELAESFRYVQAAQVTMWKQQVQDQQNVTALLHQTATDAAARP